MKTEIQIIEEQANPIVLEALQLNIISPEQMTRASTLREALKNTIKIVETVKETQFRPIKIQLDEVTSKFKPVEKVLKDASDRLSLGMGAYETLRRKEIAAEEEKIAAKVTSGYIKDETAMAKMAAIEKTETLAETSMINKPIVEIFSALSIPRQYLIPDMKLIEADLKAGIPVEGCKLVDNFVPRARA